MTKKNNQEKPKRRFCEAKDGQIIQKLYATTPTLVSQNLRSGGRSSPPQGETQKRLKINLFY